MKIQEEKMGYIITSSDDATDGHKRLRLMLLGIELEMLSRYIIATY